MVPPVGFTGPIPLSIMAEPAPFADHNSVVGCPFAMVEGIAEMATSGKARIVVVVVDSTITVVLPRVIPPGPSTVII